ncbi:hypothetical protein CPB84DRAFT_1794341, partial [Gymnopilus junonius]
MLDGSSFLCLPLDEFYLHLSNQLQRRAHHFRFQKLVHTHDQRARLLHHLDTRKKDIM